MASQHYYMPIPSGIPQPVFYDSNQQVQYQQSITGPAQQIGQYFSQPQPTAQLPNQTQNYSMSQQECPSTSQQHHMPIEYEWQTVTNKKRLRSPEESSARKQTKISDYWLKKPLETRNRFSELVEEVSNDNDTEEMQQTDVTTEPRPPPITVYNVGYIEHIHKVLTEIASTEYFVKTVGPETIKIQLEKAEHYSMVIKVLDEKKTQYHTYRPKNEKSFRVVLRGLHPSATLETITEALKEKEHEVVNVHKIKHRVSKIELPLWYIDLKPSSNNKDIYNITKLGQNEIRFEPPHTKRIIPQCARCQEYGHTKNYCRKTTKCVKCAGIHLTKDCERKSRDNNVKCVNCNGDHPANYRGCIVHKQLQQRLYPALREKALKQPQTQFISAQHIKPGMSFAQVVKNNSQNNVTPIAYNQQNTNMSKLEEMLSKLMEQMGTMLNLLTTVISKLA